MHSNLALDGRSSFKPPLVVKKSNTLNPKKTKDSKGVESSLKILPDKDLQIPAQSQSQQLNMTSLDSSSSSLPSEVPKRAYGPKRVVLGELTNSLRVQKAKPQRVLQTGAKASESNRNNVYRKTVELGNLNNASTDHSSVSIGVNYNRNNSGHNNNSGAKSFECDHSKKAEITLHATNQSNTSITATITTVIPKNRPTTTSIDIVNRQPLGSSKPYQQQRSNHGEERSQDSVDIHGDASDVDEGERITDRTNNSSNIRIETHSTAPNNFRYKDVGTAPQSSSESISFVNRESSMDAKESSVPCAKPKTTEGKDFLINDMLRNSLSTVSSTNNANTSDSDSCMLSTVIASNLKRFSPSLECPFGVEDVDRAHINDPQYCTDYVRQIMDYLLKKERKDRVDSAYLTKQPFINRSHRTRLVNWMAEVCFDLHFFSETLFLSVNLVDRFLMWKVVQKEKLQLVGVAAIMIASKFEETFTPEVNDFVILTDNSITREELISMEQMMLNIVDFNVGTPTPMHFLRRYSNAAASDANVHNLCKYLIHLSLLEYGMLRHLSSQIAAASVFIARRMLRVSPTWTASLEHYSHYTEDDIQDSIFDLNVILKNQSSSQYRAITIKFSSPSLNEVSLIAPVEISKRKP